MSASSKDPAALLRMLEARTQAPAPPSISGTGAGPARAGRPAPRLNSLLPTTERIETAGASCARVTARVELSGRRSPEGYACPVDAYRVERQAEAFSLLTGEGAWRDVDPGSVAYVDIETTGLSGGSGTVAFLIGVGRFENGAFRVRQFFMEDFHEEPALIEAVAAELDEAAGIVTYNGKRFDLPILETRWRLARRAPKFPALHLDLLYPARRLWRGRLADCRLSTVEREILGILRYSDAPSAEIPQIYFDYVRGVRPERMTAVFDHHAQDIFSLAALAGALGRAVTAPEDERFRHAADQAGLAGIFQRSGDAEAAVAALGRAASAAADEETAYRLSMLLARRLRRMGRGGEAAEIWKGWAVKAGAHRIEPLVEMAKYAEHDLRDHASAEAWTRRALEIVERDRELGEWIGGVGVGADAASIARLDALNRRLGRLGRRREQTGARTKRPAA